MSKKSFKEGQSLKQYQELIHKINVLEENLQVLTDSELRTKIFQIKKKYRQTSNLEFSIAESFALTREASSRTLGLRHFDVQLAGGLVLNSQKIAEMKTGEGKTLVATLPTCLNALTSKGVHIVTVNNYLANRDQILMGQVYRFLGFDTGLIQEGMSKLDRKLNYLADITYVTNSELTFDYLYDNMALNLDDVVLRPFNYAIVDEVDSILIDEAQTPLIVADKQETQIEKYIIAAEIMGYLISNFHYTIDEKNKNVILTEEGNKQIEQILLIQNLYDPRDPWIPYIMNAIKATVLFFKNVHYIIQNERIIIVDEFTGRIMPDRRWGEGLHQAIEAKEKVPIRQKTEPAASITYQNFFLLYPKLSGMTGTGKTAELEFEKIYNLSVEQIPTAKPSVRQDLSDLVYKDQFTKWTAIAQTCDKITSTGQPVLIGTTTVEKSELVAQILNEYKLFYQILNAKPENIRKESEIVAQAGRKNAITIATNMAGRGTDIILGGNIDFEVQKTLYNILALAKTYSVEKKKNISQISLKVKQKCTSQKFISILISLLSDKQFLAFSDVDMLRILKQTAKISRPTNFYDCSILFLIEELTFYFKKHQSQENSIVKNLGGLYIIGTERNDSRRIDNQLRGRCGRQGDPGFSRFFLSLDDTLLRIFGGPRVSNLLKNQISDNSPLESSFLTQILNSAQKQIEERAYQQRKNLFDYDEILNQQRILIYNERQKILKKSSIQNDIITYGEQVITDYLLELKKGTLSSDELIVALEDLVGQTLVLNYLKNLNFKKQTFDFFALQTYLFNEFWLAYQTKTKIFGLRGRNSFESEGRKIILVNLDRFWREHLQEMSLLRDEVGWRVYGQRDPLYEYKREAFKLFERKQKILRHLIIYNLFRAEIL